MSTALESLQNAGKDLNIEIHKKMQQDKRKTKPMYFAKILNETISPVLPYNEMNCFLLGYRKAKKFINK